MKDPKIESYEAKGLGQLKVATFERILGFIYTGGLDEEVPEDELLETLAEASFFEVNEMVDALIDRFKEKTANSKLCALQLLAFAFTFDHHDHAELKQRCFRVNKDSNTSLSYSHNITALGPREETRGYFGYGSVEKIVRQGFDCTDFPRHVCSERVDDLQGGGILRRHCREHGLDGRASGGREVAAHSEQRPPQHREADRTFQWRHDPQCDGTEMPQ